MEEYFKEMQERGLIEFKKTCNFSELMKELCDADFRSKLNLAPQVKLSLFDTVEDKLNLFDKDFICNDRRN